MNLKLKTFAASCLARSGLLHVMEHARSGDLVFALHRVLPADEIEDCYNPYIAITPESFDAFLSFIRQRAEIVSLSELLGTRVRHRNNGAKLRCAFTFDDGWEDNFRIAFPILRAHSAPATIFLVSDFVGSDSMLPEERLSRLFRTARNRGEDNALRRVLNASFSAPRNSPPTETGYYQQELKKIPMQRKLALLAELEGKFGSETPTRPRALTWEQARAMSAHKVSFGSHTVRHCILSCEDDETIRQELENSAKQIEAQTGMRVEHFAYPNGAHDERVVRLAAEAGYTAAVTTRRGTVCPDDGAFLVPRIPLDNTVLNGPDGTFRAARARLHVALSAH